MLAGILPRLASIASQPAVLAAGVATGVAVGAVGVGTGAIPVTDPAPRNAPLYECPGSTHVVTSITPNQNVLVTARSTDGQWLQIYVGEPGAERGWAPASALQLKAAPDSLPVADCTPDATPEPSPTGPEPSSVGPTDSAPVPSAVPATVAPSAAGTAPPAPTPSKPPTPTHAATPGPTGPGPFLSQLEIVTPSKDAATGTYIFYATGCTGKVTHATISVVATDPDGI